MNATVIKNYIYSGNYSEAEKLSLQIPEQELEKVLCFLSSGTLNISIFSFVRYMVEKASSAFWHKTGIDVLYSLKDKYPSIDGIENIVKYHLREIGECKG